MKQQNGAPYWTNRISSLYLADARAIPLPNGSVHCVVTSPPYWGLRDYGLPDGIGLESTLSEWIRNILDAMREVRRVLREDGTVWLNLGDAHSGSKRGTKAGGAYSHGKLQSGNKGSLSLRPADDRRSLMGGDMPFGGIPAKNVMMQPERTAIALQQPWLTCLGCETTHHQIAWGRWPDGTPICPECHESTGIKIETTGWVVRKPVVWHKPNAIPESVTDRPTSAYEMIYLLTKSSRPIYWIHDDSRTSNRHPKPEYVWEHQETGERRDAKPINDCDEVWKRVNLWRPRSYFYDSYAVRQPAQSDRWPGIGPKHGAYRLRGEDYELMALNAGVNLRNVWTIPTQPRPEAHFATFPDALTRLCILAGTSAHGVCRDCGAPWRRVTKKSASPHDGKTTSAYRKGSTANRLALATQAARERGSEYQQTVTTMSWQPGCGCGGAVVPATVLDPFVGSGTTVAVAQELGRRGVGIDLNEYYLSAFAAQRLAAAAVPLLPVDAA